MIIQVQLYLLLFIYYQVLNQIMYLIYDFYLISFIFQEPKNNYLYIFNFTTVFMLLLFGYQGIQIHFANYLIMEENDSRKVFREKRKSNDENANQNSEVQSETRNYQQQQGEQVEEKPNSPLHLLPGLQDKQQEDLSPKFIKTAQLIAVKDQSSPQSIASNMCAQQQLKKSVTMGTFIVQQLIEQVICRFQALVDMFDRAGPIAIRQTLNVLINDPNLGLSNGHMLLSYHISSTLAGDYQPKATATIEGSSGHVKIKQIPKKESSFRLTKQPSIQKEKEKEKEKQKQKPNKRISKYNSLYKKNSMKQSATLPTISQRYQSMMPDSAQSSKTQKFFDNKQNRKDKIMKNFRNSSNSKMQAELINIAHLGQQNEDNFINYLRFVKVEAEKYWSLNSVQRSQFINQYNPNIEISTLKNSNPLNSKQICRRNSLSNIQHSVLKQLQQRMNQTRKLIPSNIDNIHEEGIIPVTTIKKSKNYQSYITVQEKQQVSENIYSFDVSHVKQGNRSKNQSKKTIQMSHRTDISNTSFHYKPSSKPKQDTLVKKPLNKQTIPKESSNQMIKLPFIPIKNKKSKKEEQLSVWLKNRQKNKEYDKKFIQFINHNLCASNSISQLKSNPIEQLVQPKQQQKKRVSIKVSQKQNKKILKKHVQIDSQETNKKFTKRTRKSLQNLQMETNTYRL